MTLSDIVRNYCNEHKMSYRKFAEVSGLTSGYITMLLQDRNPSTGKPIKPTIDTYTKISDAMHMTVNDLFEIMDDAPIDFNQSAPCNYDTLSNIEIELLMAFRAANEQAKQDALNLLLAHPAEKKENRA